MGWKRWVLLWCTASSWRESFGEFTLGIIDRARCIIAIEPAPNNVVKLQKNVGGLNNVIIINKAVSNFKGKIRFHLALSPVSHSIYPDATIRHKYGTCDVEVETLDDIISSIGINIIDFVKINVEGAEIEVLEGGRQTLKMVKKVIVDANHIRNGKETYPNVKEFLKV